MTSTNIKYLDTNGNEVVKEASVVAAFNDNIVLEFGEVEGENKVVQVIYDNATGTYQAVPDSQEKGSKWYESKDKLVKILKDQLSLEEYKSVPETIHVNITREDKKIGHPLALREANYMSIKANYEKSLSALRTPKEEVIAEVPKEVIPTPVAQDVSNIQPIPEVVGPVITDVPSVVAQANVSSDIPVVDTQESEVASVGEDIQNKPFDINNIVYTEMPVQEAEREESTVPVIEDVSKSNSLLEPQPTPSPVNISSIPPTPTPIINEEPSKIMEAIQVPEDGNTISKVDNMPPIVDALKQDSIVSFPGVLSENAVNNSDQESKVENSAVEASYMDSFDKSIAQMKQATEKMQSAYEMMKSAYEQMESAMNLATETSENVKNVSHANFQEIQGMNAISRQTFENAQRMMASQNTDEQNLSRAA